MTIARKLKISFIYVSVMFVLFGCANMNLNYEEPSVEVTSLKVLPINGLAQNFEIGLKLINPNNFALPLNGISYQFTLAGESLANGVTSNIPTAQAYGESRFVVPISTSLIGGFKVIKALMDSQGEDVSYQLKTKLDIAIPFMPPLTIVKDGVIPLDQVFRKAGK
jgi:LEA14-like dessication related protein